VALSAALLGAVVCTQSCERKGKSLVASVEGGTTYQLGKGAAPLGPALVLGIEGLYMSAEMEPVFSLRVRHRQELSEIGAPLDQMSLGPGEIGRLGSFLVRIEPEPTWASRPRPDVRDGQALARANVDALVLFQRLTVREAPAELVRAKVGKPAHIDLMTGVALENGARLTGTLNREERLVLVVERGDEWRWYTGLSRHASIRIDDLVLTFQNALPGGAELSLETALPPRSIEFDRALEVSVADTLRAPDGSEWTFESRGTVSVLANGVRKRAVISDGKAQLELGARYEVRARPLEEGSFAMFGNAESVEKERQAARARAGRFRFEVSRVPG
jgi:hypothetical protein